MGDLPYLSLPAVAGPTRSSVRATTVALPPSLIGRLRAQMEKRPVDLGTRDSTLVFAVLLLGIFAISASVLIVILVVSGSTTVR